jgi:ATP-dependent helicase/nuclease subunit B
MDKSQPSVFTIAPGSQFLDVLAEQILRGFPLPLDGPKPPLASWTILLPTRRATRELARILAAKTAQKAIVLPAIRPIGDLDEDQLFGESEQGDLPKAISKSGQLLTVMSLLEQWAAENPQITLAQEIKSSPTQTLNLAKSLVKLLDQVAIEEVNFDKLPQAYDADLSEHRNAILSLINLLKVDLPRKLSEENLMGPIARRSKLIRLEADRIESGEVRGPLIAAGSTGTVPATRALLKAISLHPHGAVILPGLDHFMDDVTWSSVSPEHPQYSLRVLLSELDLQRHQVKLLSLKQTSRTWLGSELMRPSATAEQWHIEIKSQRPKIVDACQGLNLVEARDRHAEALTIALILRETLEHEGRTGALVTPDRDLAQRVKAQLRRWNILIDDSAGEPLMKFGLASLCNAVISALMNGLTAISLLNILSHSDCSFGIERNKYLEVLRNLEVAVLRGYGNRLGLDGLRLAYERAAESRRQNHRVHATIAKLNDDDWNQIHNLVLHITATLQPLTSTRTTVAGTFLDLINDCIFSLAPQADWSLAPNRMLAEIFLDLKSQSHRFPVASPFTTCLIISHLLRSEPYRTGVSSNSRLAIYGVLEARLLSADTMVLGGLNEGKWPAQPDPGPWLNRTMRGVFGMQQPERDIGISAHDFAQGFGSHSLYLTWSKRIEGAPQIPSRWILRLQTVLKVADVSIAPYLNTSFSNFADRIDNPDEIAPWAKPKPAPPIAARPTQFSVSAVERLIRDPYSLYASKILKLEALQPLSKAVDAPLRGTLFHAAIDSWNKLQPEFQDEFSLDLLLKTGRRFFDPFGDDLEISYFWWPRFVRMAKWLHDSEIERRKNTIRVHAEIDGRIEFKISGVAHRLTARADRIDELSNGHARIIDYKSGTLPTNRQIISGMKPQLPLEAAILASAGFPPLQKMTSAELTVLQISGLSEEGKVVEVFSDERSPTDIGFAHLASLKKLLSHYRDPKQVYFPRANMFKEDEPSDFDHVSRYAEWILAGDA